MRWMALPKPPIPQLGDFRKKEKFALWPHKCDCGCEITFWLEKYIFIEKYKRAWVFTSHRDFIEEWQHYKCFIKGHQE